MQCNVRVCVFVCVLLLYTQQPAPHNELVYLQLYNFRITPKVRNIYNNTKIEYREYEYFRTANTTSEAPMCTQLEVEGYKGNLNGSELSL